MKELIISKESTRFFESLGVLILSYRVLDHGLAVDAGAIEFVLAGYCGLTGVLLLLGLWVVPVRMASWFLLLPAGLALIVVDPANPSGILCCLLTTILLALSGWFFPKPLGKSIALVLVVVAGQMVALLAHPDEFFLVLMLFVVSDVLLGYLVSVYFEQFSRPGKPKRQARDLEFAELSPRENEIVRLVADDMTSKEIALALGVSSGTVRNALSLIYKKLGVPDGKALYFSLLGHLNKPEELKGSAGMQ